MVRLHPATSWRSYTRQFKSASERKYLDNLVQTGHKDPTLSSKLLNENHTRAPIQVGHSIGRTRKPVRIVPKGWGREVWIANSELYCGKILEIEKGKRCSLHYHSLKTESFFLRAGRLLVRVKECPDAPVLEEFELLPGDCMDVPRGLVHQMEALEDAELYEFSTQHCDADSHRIQKGD